jgi:hypothetical protein
LLRKHVHNLSDPPRIGREDAAKANGASDRDSVKTEGAVEALPVGFDVAAVG